MGTLLALNHPRANEREEAHYAYRARIRTEGATFTTLLSNIPAQYQPVNGQAPDVFEGEAPSRDRVLLLRAYDMTIKAKGQQLVLTGRDGRNRYFMIHDVSEGDSSLQTTMLTVSPWKGQQR